jgi:hypothetical protein
LIEFNFFDCGVSGLRGFAAAMVGLSKQQAAAAAATTTQTTGAALSHDLCVGVVSSKGT